MLPIDDVLATVLIFRRPKYDLYEDFFWQLTV